MPLVFADQFLTYTRLYRTLHIKGRTGGGKTILAWEIARELVERGHFYYMISNIKSRWRDRPEKIVMKDGKRVDAVAIFDEAGLFLGSYKNVEDYVAALRKLNICLISPSVEAPQPRLRKVQCQRMFNLYVFGLPAWIYKWRLNVEDAEEVGFFIWTYPEMLNGIYDTDGLPTDDGGLQEYFNLWTETLQKTTGYESRSAHKVGKVQSHARKTQEVAEDNNPASVIVHALEDFERQTNSIAQAQSEILGALSVGGRGRKHKKRGF